MTDVAGCVGLDLVKCIAQTTARIALLDCFHVFWFEYKSQRILLVCLG